MPSAQVKSAVLLAGLQREGRTSVLEPAATRDHTERALAEFGATVDVDGPEGLASPAASGCAAVRLTVPGDISSATFWMALAAGTPGGDVEIDGVGLNPSRTAILDIVRRDRCARVTVDVETRGAGEPMGRVRRRRSTRLAASPSSRPTSPASSTRFRHWPRSRRCCRRAPS